MVSRRRFLGQIGAVGCSAAASPLITPVVLASAPHDARLVVIILRGALDGLDAVQPYGDANLAGVRSIVSTGTKGGALDLDGFYALHAELTDLMPLWTSGELGFVHAVSTPYRNKRSHFDGQDFLENGGSSRDGVLTPAEDGWLNRLLPLIGGATETTAFSVGRERLRLISGDAPHSSWSPDAGLDLSPQAELLLEAIYQGDPLFRAAAEKASDLSQTNEMVSPARAGRAEALAEFAAARLNEETRIAAFSLGGFDTHRNQPVTIKRCLRELQTAILTLRSGLGENWDKTAVLAMTEFGRTVRENGSQRDGSRNGRRHDNSRWRAARWSACLGQWPGLDPRRIMFDRRDLMPTSDLRLYAGHVMRGLFGVEASDIEKTVFPGLDMGDEPGLLL